ncbi:unnamed protein product [Rhizoctonia solani]|uniref:DUF7918 domain-containing protein n=1 Tax=Rhizoctonia solani TaxID=456999 RepID=A0A8H3DGD1_9AGAM|nr:unnamed protein product [Rhizoctonia solani]
MPLNHLGISVWITDSEGNELPQYDIKLVDDNKIECWIPSTEGSNFKILWKILNPMPRLDLAVYPYLDGVAMTGALRLMANLYPGEFDAHQTGPSTVRLYEFGKRLLTDREDAAKPSDTQLQYLNTIVAKFSWGLVGESRPNSDYRIPQEAAPLNEKLAKKGHSGSAGLGRAVTRARLATRRREFLPSSEPILFTFRYAPRDWLKARDIIPNSPRPSPSPQLKPKRERSFSPDVIDIDDLHTDDEDIVVGKHLWEVIGDPHPGLDLCAFPYLDGVELTGSVLYQKNIAKREVGQLSKEPIGTSTAQLYEFGRRVLTDKDNGIKLDSSRAKRLNTIQVGFVWGRGGDSRSKTRFEMHEDIGPIHEKTAKKGHAGAAKLGKTVPIDKATRCNFYPNKTIKKVKFVFCYAPEDWLRAREIIMDTPEPDSQNSQRTQKRACSNTSETVDVDELDTDDDEIQFIKHLIPVPIANKKQRTTTRERTVQPKVEDD